MREPKNKTMEFIAYKDFPIKWNIDPMATDAELKRAFHALIEILISYDRYAVLFDEVFMEMLERK